MTRSSYLPDNFTLSLIAVVTLASLLPASGVVAHFSRFSRQRTPYMNQWLTRLTVEPGGTCARNWSEFCSAVFVGASLCRLQAIDERVIELGVSNRLRGVHSR